MNEHTPDKLEAAIDRVLRSVPDRRAPSGLEGRVLAEIARRAALPWWRKSYANWPASVRAVFFVGSALAAALLVSGLFLLMRSAGAAGLESGVSEPFAWVRSARDLVASAGSNLRSVAAAVPSLWFYGILGTIAACYMLLAAIGATAYRALSFGRAHS